MDCSLICLGNDSSFTCLFHSMPVHWPLHVHLFIRFCDLLCCCILIFCFVASLFCHRGLLAFCLAKMHISFLHVLSWCLNWIWWWKGGSGTKTKFSLMLSYIPGRVYVSRWIKEDWVNVGVASWAPVKVLSEFFVGIIFFYSTMHFRLWNRS